MTLDELKDNFKSQLNESIDKCSERDPKVAFGSGMLLILSALKMKDGPTIPMQITVMHAALREIGDERGWGVTKRE